MKNLEIQTNIESYLSGWVTLSADVDGDTFKVKYNDYATAMRDKEEIQRFSAGEIDGAVLMMQVSKGWDEMIQHISLNYCS